MTTSATGTGIAGLTVSGTGFCADIAYEGATLLSWRPLSADGEKGEDLVDGYLTAAELQSQNGVRNGILAPFTNRIPQGRYDFGGETHHIEPVLDHEDLVFHGFARALPFVLDQSFEENGAKILVFRTEIAPGDFKGYPYRLTIEVEYRFAYHDVTIDIRGTNRGDRPLPFAVKLASLFSPARHDLHRRPSSHAALADRDRNGRQSHSPAGSAGRHRHTERHPLS